MATTTTYQCPNCNGRLIFDGSVGKLRCEFCDSQFTPEEAERLFAEKQAKADAQASGDRAEAVAAEAGVPASGGAHRRTPDQVFQQTYEQAVSQGKSHQEATAEATAAYEKAAQALVDGHDNVVAGAAAVAAGGSHGAHAAAGVSAAQASTTEAARVEPRHTASTGDPIQDYLAQAKWDSSETEGLRAFNCPACGAQLLVDQVTAVTSCPYCGNNAVVPGQLSDVLKPDYVIPFKLDRDAAIAALKQYYGGKRLLPRDFTDNNHIEEVQGVYVPFWLYSGTADGDVSFNGRNVRTWSDSENMYTETDHWILHRQATMSFKGVPVDGSTKMPDAHMDAIEPFDYSEMVPFSMAYLPGYVTERYDLDVQQCDSRARNRVENTCIEEVSSTVGGYMETDVRSASANVNWTNIAYALLPVWMLHTRWDGEDYLFAMNGQTGKLIGDLPVDPGRAFKRFALLFLPLMIIIGLIIFFVFGF